MNEDTWKTIPEEERQIVKSHANSFVDGWEARQNMRN